MCSYKLKMHEKPFSAEAPPWTMLGSLRRSLKFPSLKRKAHPHSSPHLDAFGALLPNAKTSIATLVHL